MVVAVEEVVAALQETERRLRLIPQDDPGRDPLQAALEDLALLHKWLMSERYGGAAARLQASHDTMDRARRLLRDVKRK